MSRDDILNMPVGDALDVLVAEKVFGYKFPTVEEMKKEAEEQWVWQPDCRHFFMGFEAWKVDGEFKWRYKTKLYSTMISAAWEVVEKLQQVCVFVDIFSTADSYNVIINEGDPVKAEKAPEAICKAALLAVME